MIHIPICEKTITDEDIFSALDLNCPGLELVSRAIGNNNPDLAKRELVNYFHNRTNVKFIFDYRGKPLKQVDREENPYLFQASVGLEENAKDFCLFAAEKMMEEMYAAPGERKRQTEVGRRFETAPHFNDYTDTGKKSRRESNLFTRGQWIEYLFFLYQENGDKRVVQRLEDCLTGFWEHYPLTVENEETDAGFFQNTEDRTVMSVGWLALSYIELLYTELAYDIDYNISFDIIKHLWFLGIQFRRFDDDTYRSHNHHMWERGLVPFMLGTLFPEIPAFVEMKSKGAKVICSHIHEDFNSHGGYGEHSIAYWSGAAIGEMIFKGICLAKLNGEPLLDEEAEEKLHKTFYALAAIAPPGEFYQAVGDGGRKCVMDVLHLCGEKLGNEACRKLWQYRSKKEGQVQGIPLYYADEMTGYACARTGFGPKDTYLLMSLKKRGDKPGDSASGHNHMDMMSVSLTVLGEEFIGEPYAGSLYHWVRMGCRQRGYMYNMTSHNSVLAYGKAIQEDGMYAKGWGTFCPSCQIRRIQENEAGFCLEAFHEGYTFCRHSRKMVFTAEGNIKIHDELSSGCRIEQPHIQRWHLMPHVLCEQLAENALLLEKNGVKVLCVWKNADRLRIWKNTEMLCPDLFPSDEMIGWIIDGEFGEKEKPKLGDQKAWIETTFLNVTGCSREEILDGMNYQLQFYF